MKIFAEAIKEFLMKNSERSRPDRKPKYHRLRRLKQKREQQPEIKWFTTADSEGNVAIHPIN